MAWATSLDDSQQQAISKYEGSYSEVDYFICELMIYFMHIVDCACLLLSI